MRVFHSELVVNPELYSFGYSTYAYFETGDDLADCYRQGFLPFVGVRNEKAPMLYMARGSRVRVKEFTESSEHRRVDRRVNERFLGGIEVRTHEKALFDQIDDLKNFLLTYFRSRFGSAAMPSDRLDAILASPLLTQIVEYRSRDKIIAYTLETHGSNFFHVWYISYAPEFEGSNLGAYLFLSLVQRARAAKKDFAYLGVTCGMHMHLKTYFQPLEYWDGREWVHDLKSEKLKRLLATDSTRLIAFTDSWRDSRDAYYKPPQFKNIRSEFRFFSLVFMGLPRISRLLLFFIFVPALLFMISEAITLLR